MYHQVDSPRWPWYAIIAMGLLFIAILSSCSTTKDVRKENRASKKEIKRSNKASKELKKLVNDFPELLQKDTIRDTIPFFIPSIEVDTVVLKSDTIEISKDRWRVRIVTKLDSVYIDGGCDTMTVFVPVEIPINTIQPVEYKPMPLKLWQIALMVLGAFLILRTILHGLMSRIK